MELATLDVSVDVIESFIEADVVTAVVELELVELELVELEAPAPELLELGALDD